MDRSGRRREERKTERKKVQKTGVDEERGVHRCADEGEETGKE